MMYDNNGFDSQFAAMQSFVKFFAGAIIVMMIIMLGKQFLQWNKNNHSEIVQIKAKVTGKRTESYHNANVPGIDTYYYVTFESDDGERNEFKVEGKEYGMLAEGDYGELNYQGTRYLGFDRF